MSKNYVWLTDGVLADQRIIKVEAEDNDGNLCVHALGGPAHDKVLENVYENITWHTTEAGARARAAEMVKAEIAYLAERIVFLTKIHVPVMDMTAEPKHGTE